MKSPESILIKSYPSYIFISVSVLHIISIFFQLDSVVFASKPLLLILLALSFVWEVRKSNLLKSRMALYILLALLFSLLGDILLMFVYKDSSFFLLGLGSFLLAHVFYIISYLLVLRKKGSSMKPNRTALLSVSAYYLGFLSILMPSLQMDLKIAIVAYGFVISSMLLLSFKLYEQIPTKAFKLLAIGSLLFVISDSLIAVNKFLWVVPYSGVFIMATYILAQYLIVSALANVVKAS